MIKYQRGRLFLVEPFRMVFLSRADGRDSRPRSFLEKSMKSWAREFYRSAAWLKFRQFVMERDNYLCVRCGRPGKIVHHKVYLTEKNINDPDVSLNMELAETLCKKCHDEEHLAGKAAAEGLYFDEAGNLVKKG